MWFRLQCAKREWQGVSITFSYIYHIYLGSFSSSSSSSILGERLLRVIEYQIITAFWRGSNRVESNRIEVEVEAGSFEFSLVMSWRGEWGKAEAVCG